MFLTQRFERSPPASPCVRHRGRQGALGGGDWRVRDRARSDEIKIGVYVLVAPEPDEQQPHADDEVYVVLEGRGVLTVEGKPVELQRGMRCSSPPGRSTGSPAMSSFQCSSSSSDGDHGRGTAEAGGAAAARRLLAGGELPLGRPDLSARQPAAARALRPEQVKPRLLGHFGTVPGAEPRLRAPQPGDPGARAERDLRHRARPRRSRRSSRTPISRAHTASCTRNRPG